MILVSGATATVRRYAGTGKVGALLRPGNGNRPGDIPWAADNGAFKGFDEPAFRKLLGWAEGAPGCLWVTSPDVVADRDQTLALFGQWEPELHRRGLPVALVSQDGLGPRDVPWDSIECLFLGGTDGHKLGGEAILLSREAKRRGKLLHMGRVNSVERLRFAHDLFVDTFDGTQFSMFPDTWIPWLLERMPRIEASARQTYWADWLDRTQHLPGG